MYLSIASILGVEIHKNMYVRMYIPVHNIVELS